ncbi:MAG: hypothetical protein WDN76_11565 [Alphaproteobacteria bacterium]
MGNQVELDQLANKLKNQGWAALTPAEQTIKIILDLAKIDIDDFLKKAGSAEGRRCERSTKKSASAYLTRKFQALWEQKKVDFDIEIDGPTLNILVKDQGLHMPRAAEPAIDWVSLVCRLCLALHATQLQATSKERCSCLKSQEFIFTPRHRRTCCDCSKLYLKPTRSFTRRTYLRSWIQDILSGYE